MFALPCCGTRICLRTVVESGSVHERCFVAMQAGSIGILQLNWYERDIYVPSCNMALRTSPVKTVIRAAPLVWRMLRS